MQIVGNCKKEFETWKMPRIRTFCCLELDVPTSLCGKYSKLKPGRGKQVEAGRTFQRCHCTRQLNLGTVPGCHCTRQLWVPSSADKFLTCEHLRAWRQVWLLESVRMIFAVHCFGRQSAPVPPTFSTSACFNGMVASEIKMLVVWRQPLR